MILLIISCPLSKGYSKKIPISENQSVIFFKEFGVSKPKALPIISFHGGVLCKMRATFFFLLGMIDNFAQDNANLTILFTLSTIGKKTSRSPDSSFILS